MKQKTRTRVLSWLLSLVMVLSLVPGMSITAYAAGDSYVYGSGKSKTVDATELAADTTSWTDGSWYIVPAGGLTISGRITVNGTVNLILRDGATLTASAGITTTNATLNIYAQSAGTGALTATGSNGNSITGGSAGIGGGGAGNKATGGAGGNVNIYGGTVTATGGTGVSLNGGGAGIGGGGGGNDGTGGAGGNVNIYGGTVTSKGGNGGNYGGGGGAGIGGGGAGDGGKGGAGGNVNIYGGTVTANGGNKGAQGGGANGAGIGDGGKGDAGSAGASGTLTLGKDVKLYNGTDNTGTVLDESDNTKRSYSGSRTKNMFTEGPEHVHLHEHNFTSYTVNTAGDTITATCTPTDEEDECTLENKTATLTIAPSSKGGNTAELTGDKDEFDLTSVAITYQKKGSGGWENSATPGNDDTGFYRASFTLGGATASVTYGVSVITKGTGAGNGCSFEVPKIAGLGAKIEPTLTPAKGYEVKKITVKDENGDDVSTAVSADKTGFIMPDYNITVDVEFGMIDYTITKNTMTNGSVTVKNNEGKEITTAHYGDTITLDVAPADHFTLKSLTVKDSSNKNVAVTVAEDTRTITMPASDITVSAEFEGEPFGITTEVSPANGGTVTVSGTGVVTENNVTTAKAGSEVTLTVNADPGFTLENVTVKKASGGTVTVTDNKFTMPAEAVTVSATFAGKETTATLAVTGNEETTCTAKLLDANYKEIDSVTKKGGEQFILMVNRDEGYGFTVTYGSNSPALLEEFTEDEYKAYVDYANENNLPVSSDMVLARVTMPGVEDNSKPVTLTVNFSKLKTFTILYQPSDTDTAAVWCKFAKSGSTTAGASRMHNDAEMGDGNKVFSLKVTAAENPDQLAFATSEDSLDSAAMITGVTESQSANSWINITGGKYLVIGGEAKTVVAAFVTDKNAIPFYNSDRGEVPEQYGAGVTYRIAVVANGNPGTVTAPAAPKPSEIGTVFAGWSALVGTAPNKEEIKCAAGDPVQITENTSFSATWEPKQLTVTFNSDGGEGGTEKVTVNYKDKLPELEAPTKYGFALDGWTVDKSIVQDGNLFFRGSTFDLDTGITSNMSLTAEWTHVHTYTCYRLEEVGLKWFYDDNAVHVAFCSCYDYKIMAHEYDSNGKCACGKVKLDKGEVQLDVSYVQLIKEGNKTKYVTKFTDEPRKMPQGKYYTLSASNLWGSGWSFTKWQYSTDMGNTWKDLAVTTAVKFGVMCDMRVRAVYEESADVKPQVELNASKYDDHFEINGTSLPMDNIAFQMSYKLPANCTFVDAGLRFGDNDGIGYYDIKERTVEGNEAGIWAGCMVMHLLTFSAPEEPETSYTERYYELRKDNALNEMSATELAKHMYEGKTAKAKIDPIYWDSRVKTEGNRGAIAAIAPLNMTNAEEGNNWIYGIAWMRYKDSSGKIQTIYTNALATTLNGIVKNGSQSVTKTAAN